MNHSLLTEQNQRKEAFTRLIERLDKRLIRYKLISDRISNIRLLIVIGAVPIVLVPGFVIHPIAGLAGFMACVVAFAYVVAQHRRVQHTIKIFEMWRMIHQTHLARMALNWQRIPRSTIEISPNHPYETDIDLPDLHRLIDTAASRQGSQRLYNWLLDGQPEYEVTLARQQLVKELVPLRRFRDRLTLYAMLGAGGLDDQQDGQKLVNWLSDLPDTGSLRTAVIICAVLAPINIALFGLFLVGLLPPLWIGSFFIYVMVAFSQRRFTAHVFDEALKLSTSLEKLSSVLDFLESYNYRKKEHLWKLCQRIVDDKPSRHLRKVTWLVAAASMNNNPLLVLVLNALVPWDMYFAYRLEQRKADLADNLPHWLDTWYTLEAHCSLATFADLNPQYIFPDISVQDSTPIFDVGGLGHPLIPHQTKVSNDFRFEQQGEVVLITGSNMSGKSTFLRAVGVNLVLAYAGGPVDARQFSTQLFRLFSCIRVTDSLEDGISYFYAEVQRLKALLRELQVDDPSPLFFLIDEIFRGTNNRERLIGSRSYISELAGRSGVGLIATHDLELVQLADEHPQIENYHFKDKVENGRMVFDYKLRRGPSPTTNALKIMALEGLPVSKDRAH